MIPEIQLGNIDIGIGQVSNLIINDTPDWLKTPSQAVPIYPPVTSQIGIPIVNIPGCVESHRDSSENQTLKDEDSDGVQVFCDAGTPSYSPIDYDPRKLEITTESPPPPPIAPTDAKPPETPATPAPPRTDAPLAECPSRPDGAESDTVPSGKAGLGLALTDAFGAYGEVSFVGSGDADIDRGYGGKLGVKYNF